MLNLTTIALSLSSLTSIEGRSLILKEREDDDLFNSFMLVLINL